MVRGFVAALVALPLACPGCRERRSPSPTHVSLHGDVALVGDAAIPRALLIRVASARRMAPGDALGALISDSLLAREAEASGLGAEPGPRWASAAALARVAAERLVDEARADGAPSDAELAWVRVSHAVVLRSSAPSVARALAVAESLRQVATSARSGADFVTRAREVVHPGVLVTVEALPAFDIGGRGVDGTQFDGTFVAAAFALRAPGDVSEIVESPFGWHVLRLVERRPPEQESLESRRVELAQAALQARVRTRTSAAIRAMRSTHPVDISAGADPLMARAAATSP